MRDRKQHAGNAIPQGFPWPAGPDAVRQTNETQRACAGAGLFCGLRDHGRQVEATCRGCDPMRPHSMGVGNAIPQGFPWPAGPDAAHPTNETQRGQERASPSLLWSARPWAAGRSDMLGMRSHANTPNVRSPHRTWLRASTSQVDGCEAKRHAASIVPLSHTTGEDRASVKHRTWLRASTIQAGGCGAK
jgi:hypothetical protein